MRKIKHASLSAPVVSNIISSLFQIFSKLADVPDAVPSPDMLHDILGTLTVPCHEAASVSQLFYILDIMALQVQLFVDVNSVLVGGCLTKK